MSLVSWVQPPEFKRNRRGNFSLSNISNTSIPTPSQIFLPFSHVFFSSWCLLGEGLNPSDCWWVPAWTCLPGCRFLEFMLGLIMTHLCSTRGYLASPLHPFQLSLLPKSSFISISLLFMSLVCQQFEMLTAVFTIPSLLVYPDSSQTTHCWEEASRGGMSVQST